MRAKGRLVCLLAAAGLCASASGQDSVSQTGFGPGDAFSPYDTMFTLSQRSQYVVDLTPLFTSWGTVFGIAPIAKTPRVSGDFFNNLPSSSGMSQTQLQGAAFPGEYWYWNAPGFGVNDTWNTLGRGTLLDPSFGGSIASTQIAAVMSDFGARYNGVVTSVINYRPDNPARLFVTRVQSAVNSAEATADDSQFGVGSVDASGFSYFRADSFGSNGPNQVSGNNYFRVGALARDPSRTNHLSSNMSQRDLGATVQPVNNSGVTLLTPANIPSDLTGGTPIIAGADFNNNYVYGDASVTTTSAHRAGSAEQTRGTPSFSPASFIAGSVGTMAILGRSVSGGDVDTLVLWDVDASGNVLRSSGLMQPSSVSDPVDAFTQSPPGQFDHYRSQVAFRGGNGQVAVNILPDGTGVAAAVTYNTGFQDDPLNSLLVARFDPSDPAGTATWTLAGWIDLFTLKGKPIKDGPGGNIVGRLVPLFEVTGGSPLGPSISPPAIDAGGNVWFVASVELYKTDANGNPFTDLDSALIRAVYDPASGGYELEKVLETGDVFRGKNSCRDYQIQFMGVADNDSVASSTLFSNGMVAQSWNNVPVSGLEPRDPRNLGGISLLAKIVYDADGDGTFRDPTGQFGDPTSGDEAYQVLLYVGNIDQGFGYCPADLTGSGDPNSPNYGVPDGNIDASDFFFYLDLFATSACGADLTGSGDPNSPNYGVPDGNVDAADFFFFLDQFVAGCN